MRRGCALPSWGSGACPQKNQFCAKNYAILSKFWYFFPILQQKVGQLSPSPESGGLISLSPCSDAYVNNLFNTIVLGGATRSTECRSSPFFLTSCARGDTICLCPCKLTISSYLFARWHLFWYVSHLGHQQQVDLWPFDLESGVRVTCGVGYLCVSFSLHKASLMST